MNYPFETEFDTYRLLVMRRNACELLLIAEGHRFSPPSVRIPRWERVAQQLTTAVKDHWGLEAYCLFTPALTHSQAWPSWFRYQVMESCRPNDNPPAGFSWVAAALAV